MKESQTVPGVISLTFNYAAGRAASRFFVELRDHQRILGVRCPECRRVLVPAHSFCPRCLVDTSDWLEVGPQGTLMGYTLVRHVQPHQRHLQAEPLIYGLIRLDGADTNFVHLLGEVDCERIEIGMRVEAVFKENREGGILDIAYFKPVENLSADNSGLTDGRAG